jgi:hypothetical protein
MKSMSAILQPAQRTELRSRASRERLAKMVARLFEHADLLARCGHLLGIHEALRIIFPHDRDLAYRWVTTPNRRFADRPPLEIMKQGFEGLLAVRRYLDFERGR